ncbi:butyrophilin-like protein 2 [Archocentrus centrarchus]|uniref:butyrophilin-like protein 2 n=1 Tax=Archocentrus centrarchus TaxID=63155 RepID=UPI0011E9FD6C|nr:butyrophilin-like protein 2 [Archocentrus centrarchus]
MSPVKVSLLLVLHHGVLLFLTRCCEGQSHMIGPTQPVVAMIGDDIILPCHLEPAVDAVKLTVEWSKQDLTPRFVYVRRVGVELLTEQNSLYTKRTSLSVSKLQCGDISLKLSTVKLSDAGTYKCLVPKFGAESAVQLAVGSVSSPLIELSTVKNKVVLECKSNGWYPEPQLLWLNREGKLISAEPTKTVRGSDGLYTVSSKVSVEKGHSYSFTCRVQQKSISQIKEAHIHVSGQSHMIGPTQPVVAMIGDDIILPCHLEPAVNAGDLTVEWSRNDLKPRFVYLRRDGVELLTEQNSLYTRRTSLSVSKLQCGDISLKLSTVKLSDAGTYKCHAPEFSAESVMELTVGSVSSPLIELSTVKDKVVLECESNGWYPEPQLLWLNSEGKLISAEPTKTVRGSDGLYTVSSKVSVEKGHSYSFTCRVQQKSISQIKEAHIHVSDDLFMVQSDTAVHIIVNLVLCLISVGTITSILFIIWRQEQKKTDEREMRMEEHSQREGEEKNRLKDELKNHEEDLTHIHQIIKNQNEKKKDLKNQRDKLNSLLQEDKAEMKEVTSKLKKPPKKKHEQWQDDLKKRMEEHEELLVITDKLMEATENIIIQMTERKVKLEKDTEKNRKHLKN